MPQKEYVINLENNKMTTYRYRMHREDLVKQFGRQYRIAHDGGKVACLLGMRADKFLRRYSGFPNKRHGYKETCWISKQFKDVWCASPLYDWSMDDIWHATYLSGYDYNHLHDLYYAADLKPSQMHAVSPFNNYVKDTLNLYRVQIRRFGISPQGVYRERISSLFMERPGQRVIEALLCRRAIHGNPIRNFYWIRCQKDCGIII